MFYPKSQIKSNLYTNGSEYILSTTKENYIGYYYQVSSGKSYTGKSPNDKPNTLLIPINTLLPTNTPYTENTQTPSDQITLLPEENYNLNNSTILRSLPIPNPNVPTQKDYSLGVFQRYFCKKNNELIYIEIDKKTYDSLQMQSPTIAWDLYSPLYTMWYIKGNKEQTYKANKNLISLIEQKEKWYGFSQYFKEDYLKYYLAS